jgi:hypothetical protein
MFSELEDDFPDTKEQWDVSLFDGVNIHQKIESEENESPYVSATDASHSQSAKTLNVEMVGICINNHEEKCSLLSKDPLQNLKFRFFQFLITHIKLI